MKHILEVAHLTKTYPATRKTKKPFTAVNNISFQLGEGEILGILGPNGAGKSTTISMLMGVLTPTSGTITAMGKDLHEHHSEVMNTITYASTYVSMPWRLSIYENLRVASLLYGVSKKDFEKRSKDLLGYFGVWDQRNKTISELSAGQTTRVMLAKAFIPNPKIALLDEPTASLDPEIAHQVRSFVLEQQKQFGTSIIYTSHNMDEVNEVCDRVMFLKNGNIVAEDTPEHLLRSFSSTQLILTMNTLAEVKKLEQLITTKQLSSTQSKNELTVDILIDEHDIAEFLHTLSQKSIQYHHIDIEKPTLEQYFLEIAKK